ncbi:MAG: VWA domain-containing protein [Deltaproteobacteria bacterium]|nr:VWA domain-containing protein [Deltaproteobacteria bacterium]
MAPPTLAPVTVVPPSIDRSVVTRVRLRDPTALAATQVDLHRQSDGVIDILWIVDTTGSMANQRTSLADNFNHFIDTLTRLSTDFRIGVTSTDMSRSGERGALRGQVKIIDNDTPDPQRVFRTNTTFPESRKRWMQSLRAMEAALDPSGPNPGFLRQGAALAVIVVSDADDESEGGTAYYSRRLRSMKGPGYENLVSFSAIAGTLPDGCWPPGEETYFGSKAGAAFRLSDMARRTGGVFASICDEGFENSLIRIAQALNTLKRIFPLTLKPDPATLSVLVDGVPVAPDAINGWEYRAEINSVAFSGDYVPAPGSFVQIFYAIDRE